MLSFLGGELLWLADVWDYVFVTVDFKLGPDFVEDRVLGLLDWVLVYILG